jgi:hypothetical protein
MICSSRCAAFSNAASGSKGISIEIREHHCCPDAIRFNGHVSTVSDCRSTVPSSRGCISRRKSVEARSS